MVMLALLLAMIFSPLISSEFYAGVAKTILLLSLFSFLAVVSIERTAASR
jgi:hypothetical protein